MAEAVEGVRLVAPAAAALRPLKERMKERRSTDGVRWEALDGGFMGLMDISLIGSNGFSYATVKRELIR
jgi:hypothetical protein